MTHFRPASSSPGDDTGRAPVVPHVCGAHDWNARGACKGGGGRARGPNFADLVRLVSSMTEMSSQASQCLKRCERRRGYARYGTEGQRHIIEDLLTRVQTYIWCVNQRAHPLQKRQVAPPLDIAALTCMPRSRPGRALSLQYAHAEPFSSTTSEWHRMRLPRRHGSRSQKQPAVVCK